MADDVDRFRLELLHDTSAHTMHLTVTCVDSGMVTCHVSGQVHPRQIPDRLARQVGAMVQAWLEPTLDGEGLHDVIHESLS